MTDPTDLMSIAAKPVSDPERRRLGVLLWLIGVIVVAGLAGGVTATFIGLRSDVHELTLGLQSAEDESAGLSADVDTLRGQLLAAGETPAVPDPGQPDQPAGGRGESGANGSNGRDGRDGLNGPPGDPGPAGLPGANGADGTNGGNGTSGVDGLNGFDGAQGPTGATGTQGVPGPQGDVGPQGPQGFEGPPGQGPGSFRFTFGGVTFVCTDPEADRSYECNPEAA